MCQLLKPSQCYKYKAPLKYILIYGACWHRQLLICCKKKKPTDKFLPPVSSTRIYGWKVARINSHYWNLTRNMTKKGRRVKKCSLLTQTPLLASCLYRISNQGAPYSLALSVLIQFSISWANIYLVVSSSRTQLPASQPAQGRTISSKHV